MLNEDPTDALWRHDHVLAEFRFDLYLTIANDDSESFAVRRDTYSRRLINIDLIHKWGLKNCCFHISFTLSAPSGNVPHLAAINSNQFT